MNKIVYDAGPQFKKHFLYRGHKYFENLYLYLTDACNMHCKHCYLGERLNKKESMTFLEAKAHLEFWRKIGSSKVCFLGGEPTLYENLYDSVKYAQMLGYEQIIINTNLTDTSYKVMEKFNNREVSYIQTSLDGATQVIHDKIRRPGAFKETTNSISKLVEQGHDVRVIMTVNRSNVEDVIPMIKLAKQLGCSLVKFHLMSEIGNANKQDSIQGLTPGEWYQTCETIKHYSKSIDRENINISYQPAYTSFYNKDAVIAAKYLGCVGKNYERMSVFPNGNGYVCSFLFDREDSFIHVKSNVIEIRSNSIENDFLSSSCNGCNRCGYDGCKAENIIIGKTACDEEYYPVCRLWKVEI